MQGGALGAKLARQAERQGTPLAAADGWLLSGRALVLRAGPVTAMVTLTGLPPAAADAALARLIPHIAQRLRAGGSPASAPPASTVNGGQPA